MSINCTFFFCAGATLCWEPCWAPASCAAGAGRRQGASSSVPRLLERSCQLAASQPPPLRIAPIWRKMLRQGYAVVASAVFQFIYGLLWWHKYLDNSWFRSEKKSLIWNNSMYGTGTWLFLHWRLSWICVFANEGLSAKIYFFINSVV